MGEDAKALAPTAGEVLPGEEVEDAALLDRVVEELNGVWRAQGLATARALAGVVLDAFFRGDPALYEARRGWHASLRALAARADLQFNYQALWTALAVTVQCAALPAPVAEALPVSHHKALLPLKDAAVKAELAAEAAREGWTVRELEARVRDARGAAPGGARPRRGKPALVGALEQLVAAATVAGGEMPAAAEELDALGAALAELRAVVEQAAALDLADGDGGWDGGDDEDE